MSTQPKSKEQKEIKKIHPLLKKRSKIGKFLFIIKDGLFPCRVNSEGEI